MIGVPNVKFMDLFVFIGGYLMGLVPGAIVGVLIWLIYGTLNPYGFNLIILAATCLGETFYAVAGWLSAKFELCPNVRSIRELNGRELWLTNLKFGVIGFLATFFYDLFTNIVSVVIVGLPPLIAIISGAPFAAAHEASNFIFFFFGCSPLIFAIKKLPFIRR
ncbi:MAG: hypothetical protein N3E47_06245 [Candidatus Bathyarchaeota archaeon]|nr:hypothetical protein [Candidatus Bathyarchaeota archaeon]